MKKISLLLSLGVFCASLALAQGPSTSGQAATPTSDNSAGAKTVQGCLNGGDGNYMLTEDATGVTYKLVGDETQLKKHLGHEVSVSGQSTSDAGSQASATDQEQAQPSTNSSGGTTILVTDVKMVSEQCHGSALNASQ